MRPDAGRQRGARDAASAAAADAHILHDGLTRWQADWKVPTG